MYGQMLPDEDSPNHMNKGPRQSALGSPTGGSILSNVHVDFSTVFGSGRVGMMMGDSDKAVAQAM